MMPADLVAVLAQRSFQSGLVLPRYDDDEVVHLRRHARRLTTRFDVVARRHWRQRRVRVEHDVVVEAVEVPPEFENLVLAGAGAGQTDTDHRPL